MAKQSKSFRQPEAADTRRSADQKAVRGYRKTHRHEEESFDLHRYPETIATVVEEPFDSPEWIFHVIRGGIPVRALCGEKSWSLLSQRGRNLSRFFPEISSLPCSPGTVLHGEIVNQSAMESVHRRLMSSDEAIEEDALRKPCELIAHDLLFFERSDFTARSQGVRWDALARALSATALSGTRVTLVELVERDGIALHELSCAQGFQSILGKLKGSVYPGGESRLWREARCDRRMRLVVGGYRLHDGMLILECGSYVRGELEFERTVKVEAAEQMELVIRHLFPLTRRENPFRESLTWAPGLRWIAPELVLELRDGTFERIRVDLEPVRVHPVMPQRWRARRPDRAVRRAEDGTRRQRRLKF